MARQPRRTSQSQVLNPVQRFELHVYRALGVPPFRRALFSLERFRYRWDGQTNRNYHMRTVSPGGAAAFESYLLYHNLLHGVSLALLVTALLGKAGGALPWNGMDILAVGMCVINLWCLMLQRYNWLRLQELRIRARRTRARRLNRRVERVLAALGETDGAPEMREDLVRVRALLAKLSAGDIVYLGADDVPCLRRMAALLEASGSECGRGKPAPEKAPAPQPMDCLARELAARAEPYSRTERRADRLQRLLLPGRVPLLSLCAVVTEDGLAEAAFSALLRCSKPEQIRESLILLEAVLERLSAGDTSICA